MQSNVAQISLQMRKLDNCRELLINLTDGGKPYLITPGSVAVFVCKNADGESFERNCTIQNSVISCLIDRGITFLPGVIDAEIRLYGPYRENLASPRFLIVVNDRVAFDVDYSVPDDEMDVIDALIDRINDGEAERKAAEISRESAEAARQQRFNTDMETYGERIAQSISSAQIADGLAQSALNSANEAVTRANVAASVAEQASNTANKASEKANEAASMTISPVVTVTTISGGHRVNITDVNGTKSFDVLDGEDGEVVGGTKIATGSYEGTGSASKTLTFDFTPRAVFVQQVVASGSLVGGSMGVFLYGCGVSLALGQVDSYMVCKTEAAWTPNTLTTIGTTTGAAEVARAIEAFNMYAQTYHYVAIG
jgi:hypothetical protein